MEGSHCLKYRTQSDSSRHGHHTCLIGMREIGSFISPIRFCIPMEEKMRQCLMGKDPNCFFSEIIFQLHNSNVKMPQTFGK